MGRIIQVGIASSGTATSCVDKIKTFIIGGGFDDKDFYSSAANPEQSFEDLLADAAMSLAPYKGFYLNVQVNAMGEPTHFYIMDFDTIRRDSDGGFWYKKCWDKSTKGAIKIPQWKNDYFVNPKDALSIIQNQIHSKDCKYKQVGFIYFAYHKSMYLKHYPLGGFYAGFEDVESDAGLQKLEHSNITAGFKTDVIIRMLGSLDTENDDDHGETDMDMLQKRVNEFRDPATRKALILQAEEGNLLPEVTIFPLNQLLDGVDKARVRVPEFVCRHFNVPPIIVGFRQPEGWGSTQALVNSMVLFNQMVLEDQNLIIRTLQKFLPNAKINIGTLALIRYIDPAILPDLTQDERRALGGYDEIPKTDTGSGPSLAEQIGVGGVTSLKEVVADPAIDKASKVQFLIIVFNLTEENANRLVYGTAVAPANTQAA
jgi:hypothetical protein